jgi:hypothetical protein
VRLKKLSDSLHLNECYVISQDYSEAPESLLAQDL